MGNELLRTTLRTCSLQIWKCYNLGVFGRILIFYNVVY